MPWPWRERVRERERDGWHAPASGELFKTKILLLLHRRKIHFLRSTRTVYLHKKKVEPPWHTQRLRCSVGEGDAGVAGIYLIRHKFRS